MASLKLPDPISKVMAAALVIVIAAGAYLVYTYKNQPAYSVITTTSQPTSTSLLGATLSYREGGVQRKHGDGDWEVATESANLTQGDQIRIVGLGRAIITLDDGSAIRLADDSTAILEKLTPGEIIIRNESGQLYARVAPLAKRTFAVRTATATYTSLGTAYRTINQPGTKGVEVYESAVKVSENGKEVEVPEGQKYLLESAQSPDKARTLQSISGEELEADGFVIWNKEKDEAVSEYREKLGVLTKVSETPKPTDTPKPAATPIPTQAAKTATPEPTKAPTPKPIAKAALQLKGQAVDGGIYFSWSAVNLETGKGFKLVRSEDANPSYPGNEAVYLENGKSSYTWSIKDGRAYHFRICTYTGEGCGTYSNDITVTAPKKAEEPTSAVGALKLERKDGAAVEWSVKGYSKSGFKLVYSKNSGPTYPTRSGDTYQYFSDPATHTATLDAFDGPGRYYVRVCEYLGGKCGVYSNQVEVDL